MANHAVIIDALKVALIVYLSGQLVFAVDYTRMTKWDCWRDPLGLTLVLEALFGVGALAPLLLAAFWHLSVLGSEIGSWCLIAFFFLGGVVMYWRTFTFERVNPGHDPVSAEQEIPAPQE